MNPTIKPKFNWMNFGKLKSEQNMTNASMAATKAWQTRKANKLSEKERLTAIAKKAWETRRKNEAVSLANPEVLKEKDARRNLHKLVNKLSHKQALQILHTLISPKKFKG